MYVGIDSMLLKRESVSLVGEKGKPFKGAGWGFGYDFR